MASSASSSKGPSVKASAIGAANLRALQAPTKETHADPMVDDDDDDLLIGSSSAQPSSSQPSISNNTTAMDIDTSSRPSFTPLSKSAQSAAASAADAVKKGQLRKISIPPHRMTPLKADWAKIYTPLVEIAGLQVRMNVPRKMVEIRVSRWEAAVQ